MSSLLRRLRRPVRVILDAIVLAAGTLAGRAAGAARPSVATSSWRDAPRIASTTALAKAAARESSWERSVGMGRGLAWGGALRHENSALFTTAAFQANCFATSMT